MVGNTEAKANIYLMAGQSNRLGASIKDARFEEREPDKNIRLYPEIAFVGSSPFITRADYPEGDKPDLPRWLQRVPRAPHKLAPVCVDGRMRMGPEVRFGRLLHARYGAAHNTVIVKYAVGGSSLERHWMHSKSVDLADRMIMFLSAVEHQLRADGEIPVVKGFLWNQGESDAMQEADAAAYYDNLSRLIAKVRRHANSPFLPTTIVQTHIDTSLYPTPFLDVVRDAQRRYVAADPFAALVEIDDIEHFEDGVHYKLKGVNKIGRREFDAYVGILKSLIKENAPAEAGAV